MENRRKLRKRERSLRKWLQKYNKRLKKEAKN
jgi:hypothetical protein